MEKSTSKLLKELYQDIQAATERLFIDYLSKLEGNEIIEVPEQSAELPADPFPETIADGSNGFPREALQFQDAAPSYFAADETEKPEQDPAN